MRPQTGFTLPELMITLVVLGILVGIGFPSLLDFVQANRMVGQINQVTGLFFYARSEAVRRGSRVTVCPSSDFTTCGNDVEWETGRIVFTDSGTAGTKDGSDEILRKQELLAGSNTLRGSAAFDSYVSFLGTGYTSGSGSNTGTLSLCDSRGTAEAYTISINAAGRIRTSKTATSCP